MNKITKPALKQVGFSKAPPAKAAPAGYSNGEMVEKIKGMKSIRRKPMLNKRKIFKSELSSGDCAWVLFENEELEASFTVTCEFKLTGYCLEEPDEDDKNTITFELAPGDKIIKKLLPAEIVKKNAPKKKAGGFNPMAGITDMYE